MAPSCTARNHLKLYEAPAGAEGIAATCSTSDRVWQQTTCRIVPGHWFDPGRCRWQKYTGDARCTQPACRWMLFACLICQKESSRWLEYLSLSPAMAANSVHTQMCKRT